MTLAVDNIEAARNDLIERGIKVSEIFHFADGPFNDAINSAPETVVDFPPPVVPMMPVWRGSTDFLSVGIATTMSSCPTTKPTRASPPTFSTREVSVALRGKTGLFGFGRYRGGMI
jgi:hypothetical protein